MSRKQLLSRVTRTMAQVAAGEKKIELLLWGVAADAVAIRGTFPEGTKGTKAFTVAVATAAGKSESWVTNLVRAHETRATLSQEHRKATSAWSTGSVYQLKGTTPAQRSKIIAAAEKKGTTSEKEIRKIRKDVVPPTKRDRSTATDRKIRLAEELASDFKRLTKSHDVVALIAGAQLAQDNPGKDVAGALLFWNAQVTTAAAVVTK